MVFLDVFVEKNGGKPEAKTLISRGSNFENRFERKKQNHFPISQKMKTESGNASKYEKHLKLKCFILLQLIKNTLLAIKSQFTETSQSKTYLTLSIQ